MLTKYFLLLFFLFQHKVKSEGNLRDNSNCDDFADCFNCTFSPSGLCAWNGNKCSKSKKKNFYNLRTNYPKCLDESSQRIISQFCPKLIMINETVSFLFTSNYKSNLLCYYEILNPYANKLKEESNLLYIDVQKGEKISILFSFTYALYERYEAVKTDSYSVQIGGIKRVGIYIHFNEGNSSETKPLTIKLSFRVLNISMLSKITILLIVLFCLLILVISVFILVHLYVKSINWNKKRNLSYSQIDFSAITVSGKVEDNLAIESQIFSDNLGGYDNQCSICLEDFKNKDNVYLLACKHVFHTNCIKEWIKRNSKAKSDFFCPNCHRKLIEDFSKKSDEDSGK